MNPMNWARFNPYGNQHGATEKWPELYQLYEEITPFMVDVNINPAEITSFFRIYKWINRAITVVFTGWWFSTILKNISQWEGLLYPIYYGK